MKGLWLAGVLLTPVAAVAATERIEVIVAVEVDGTASELWGDLLRRHGVPAAAAAEAVALRRPLAAGEKAWVERVRARATEWPARLPELEALFAPVEAPASIRVVLGNRAGEDGFIHDPRTIGFDVSKLAALYGDAGTEENRERLDRLFVHEYVHLLQKAWLPAHPQPEATPFELAEFEIWSEGLGNYYSMSSRWRAPGGVASAAARSALERLEPRFLERMTALACAPPTEAARLTADLSSGPFAQKWGALTAALWLEQEASVDPGTLRRFVQAGAAGVRELAGRHLPAGSFAELERARAKSRDCPR